MESVFELVEILKSQVSLYTDMRDILDAEKECVVTWNSDKTIELVKKKDTLSYKEKVLDEAFRNHLKKVGAEVGIENIRVRDITEEMAGEHYTELVELRKQLIRLIKDVTAINTSLKILYKTNISLIEGVFGKLGIAGKNTYGINRAYSNARTSTISRTG